MITILWFHFEETRRPGRTGPAAGARGPGRGGGISTSLWRLGALGEICGKSGGIWKKCPEISGFFRFMLEKKSIPRNFERFFLLKETSISWTFIDFCFFWEGVAGVEISDVKEFWHLKILQSEYVYFLHIYSLSL